MLLGAGFWNRDVDRLIVRVDCLHLGRVETRIHHFGKDVSFANLLLAVALSDLLFEFGKLFLHLRIYVSFLDWKRHRSRTANFIAVFRVLSLSECLLAATSHA